MSARNVKAWLAVGILVTASLVLVSAVSAPAPGLDPKAATSRQLSGTVVDATTGAPVADAVITTNANGRQKGPALGRSSGDGTFAVAVPAAHSILTVTAPGYATFRQSLAVAGAGIRVQLDKAVTMRGRITAADGALLPGTVSMTSTHPRNFISTAVRTESGRFEIPDLLPVPAYLVGRAPGHGAVVKRVAVTPGAAVDDVVFTLREAAAVDGRVVDERGAGVPGVEVEVEFAMPTAERLLLTPFVAGWKTTNGNGEFRLRELPAGVPFSLVVDSGAGQVKSAQLTLTPGQVWRQNLPLTTTR